MLPFRPRKIPTCELPFDNLPWVPQEMRESLAAIVAFLIQSFKTSVSSIGLYGSWQRGQASAESDVDLVVFMADDVAWFDHHLGVVNRSAARRDKLHWHAIGKKANAYRHDARVYSIAVVTPAMLEYYSTQGAIHLQNWAHALRNCYLLWKK